MGIVDGTEPCPSKFIVDASNKETLNPAFVIWKRKDQTILSWINLTLSKKVLSTIYGLETSRQVWTALANQFANQSKSRIANLKKQLQSLHQGSKSCSDYIQAAKERADQLVAVGQPISDEDLITYLTNGLNSSYNSFITTISILTRDKQLSFEDFQDELLNHEMLLNNQKVQVVDTSTFALFNQKQGPRFHSPRPHGRPPFPKYSPRHFGNKSEAAAPTTRYNPIPPPTRYSGPPRYSAPRPTHYSRPIFSSAPRIPCQISGKLNHIALDCFHRMDYAFQGRRPPPQLQAMVAQSNTAYEDQEWYADSAANAHITHDVENLQIQQPFQSNDIVGVGNGAALAIAHSGAAILHSPQSAFHLKNVLHCPQAAANLVSIQRFCLDNACYFILTASHYYIIDLQTQTILLEGKSENGMYPLRFGKKNHKSSKAFTAMLGIKTTSLVWHFRLGHPSPDIVTRVVKENKLPLSSSSEFNKINKVICSSCQLGKGKKQPFHASNRISTAPLQLVHSDIWTSPILSNTGFKYYIAFIDDFSRYTWIYHLHQKSDAFSTFVKFKALVENQFSHPIKQFQFDGGGEYTSLQFQSFLTQHGIDFRKSCPYTSPQNGLAERKLRHILETGLTLLAHANLSKKYWVDSFLTAVYTINRLPTATLNFLSPYEKLHQKSPDYHKLRVFGCLCYPLLRPYNPHKLEFKSKPCIFLGYQYAGYKCLDPVTNNAYHSRHVVFDETSFPAKDQATSLLPSQLPVTGKSVPSFLHYPQLHITANPPLVSSLTDSISPSSPLSSPEPTPSTLPSTSEDSPPNTPSSAPRPSLPESHSPDAASSSLLPSSHSLPDPDSHLTSTPCSDSAPSPIPAPAQSSSILPASTLLPLSPHIL
jgi:transposase InsO family protein